MQGSSVICIASSLIAAEPKAQSFKKCLEVERLLRNGNTFLDFQISEFGPYLCDLFQHLSRQETAVQKAFMEEFPHALKVIHFAFKRLIDILPDNSSSSLTE
eukprot:Gregarina_sp_Poly_1__9697@NODE_615_length_7127_cov_142_509207_g471_i0_p6_GENE_NODE_615_length_7127_cov_142_509207_g471_i0NODE_615_length_7127_cov_142_509207_g471_i0_p6_ORF_typecomplete_len102_score13_23_NODE_615_length_7127_cov_142_509207_g471_i052035508